MIPLDTPSSETVISHLFYDQSDVKVDLEIMFPLAALHRLQRESKVESIAPHHFSFQ
ncbi:hypothetical protein [Cytobacillus praedii]|uniref:hypothetical protein n=1 Tax=Cytobacillus praedii TaxID=1742358 RepID=UPI003AF5C8AF